MGRVAYQRECLGCNASELSREYALNCANVRDKINQAFPQLTYVHNKTIMDIALDSLSFDPGDLFKLNTLAKAVVEIKKRCLKWKVNRDGNLVSPSNETYPST